MDSLQMDPVYLSKEGHQLHPKEEPEFACQVFKKSTDLFKDEVGSLLITCKMTLDADTQSVVRPACHIPVTMRDKVKAELDRMTSLGVIVPVLEPNEWVSAMVATHWRKTEELRHCIDS